MAEGIDLWACDHVLREFNQVADSLAKKEFKCGSWSPSF